MVRRLTIRESGWTKDFGLQSPALSLDYGMVKIGKDDYLLPLRSVLQLRHAKAFVRNETVFRELPQVRRRNRRSSSKTIKKSKCFARTRFVNMMWLDWRYGSHTAPHCISGREFGHLPHGAQPVRRHLRGHPSTELVRLGDADSLLRDSGRCFRFTACTATR